MSRYIFIAADIKLAESKNPHYKELSINQALEMGIDVDEELLESIDRDAPDVILWSDTEWVFEAGKIHDGDLPDDFALIETNLQRFYCDKAFGVTLEWVHYTKERGEKIVGYIKSALEKTDNVEMWSVWTPEDEFPKYITTSVKAQDLTAQHIEQLDSADIWKQGVSWNGEDRPTYYCLKITN